MRQAATVAEQYANTVREGDFSSPAPQTGKRKASALEAETTVDGKKKRAPRKPKDPNAPKRPASSYLLFQNDIRADLKSKFPDLSNSDLLRMISERWAAMSEADKEVGGIP